MRPGHFSVGDCEDIDRTSRGATHDVQQMKKNLLLLPCAVVGAILLTSCEEDPYAYDNRPAYHGNSRVDFHYSSGRPYSHNHGPLYRRDGRYYYSRGGSYVVYDQPTTVYRSPSTRTVTREISVRDSDDRRRGDNYDGRRYDDSPRYQTRLPRERTYSDEDRSRRDVYVEQERSQDVYSPELRRPGSRVRVIER